MPNPSFNFNKVKDTKFNRGGVTGLDPFLDGTAPEELMALYTIEEIAALGELKDTPKDPEDRMRVKVSAWYAKLALGSTALNNLVTVDPSETVDLAGEPDSSNQIHYMPKTRDGQVIDGLLHKYPEIVLLYAAKTCSAHCRYCYRLDLFSGKTGKGLASIEEVVEYISDYNKNVEMNSGVDPKDGTPIFPITEALLSGGDPMVMTNSKLAKYLVAMAEAGVGTIRIGTKELAFFPERFDQNFFDMIDQLHKSYPDVRLKFIVHFTHPDEFLAKGEDGNYIKTGNNKFQWMPEVDLPVEQLMLRRNFVSVENQTPIIRKVNDDARVLHTLQREMDAHGIGNHYLFQCRQIEGHRAFAVPVEETLKIHTQSLKGLSGTEQHAKLAMSTSIGKMEIVGTAEGKAAEIMFGVKPEDAKNGVIVFKMLRSPHEVASATQGNLIIAKRMPDALWITDYINNNAILYDGTGLLTPKEKPQELLQLDATRLTAWLTGARSTSPTVQ